MVPVNIDLIPVKHVVLQCYVRKNCHKKNNQKRNKKEKRSSNSEKWKEKWDWHLDGRYLKSVSCQFLFKRFHVLQYADLKTSILLLNARSTNKQLFLSTCFCTFYDVIHNELRQLELAQINNFNQINFFYGETFCENSLWLKAVIFTKISVVNVWQSPKYATECQHCCKCFTWVYIVSWK